MPLRQTMQGLASEELLADLALERDAVGSMLSCREPSSENPAPRSIPKLPTCPVPGAHSSLGISFACRATALDRRSGNILDNLRARARCRRARHNRVGLDRARQAIAVGSKWIQLLGQRERRNHLGLLRCPTPRLAGRRRPDSAAGEHAGQPERRPCQRSGGAADEARDPLAGARARAFGLLLPITPGDRARGGHVAGVDRVA